jgi:opacity protein-like surface antigen
MKYILLAALIMPVTSHAQRFQLDFYGAVSNYQGDLQAKRFTFSEATPAAGLGISYFLTSKVVLRTAFTYAKVGADDRNNPTGRAIQLRNLNFTSNIYEGQLALEYNLFDLTERSVTPYVFAGVAGYHFNPYTKDPGGDKVYLQPLSTEGQGLPAYPESKPYNLTQLAIPFGGGLKFAVTEDLRFGIELGFRKLFTDYLDDVSTNYVDSATLANVRGPVAVELAYRGDEVGGGTYPEDGAQRGSPKFKDWYYLTGIRISYVINNGNGRKNKSKLGCPVNL